MELFERVRIPQPTDRVYKRECCISFDTPKSEGGLFVDMNSFFAFGKDYVRWNYEKSGNPIYLHITETRKRIDDISEDMLFEKLRLLDADPMDEDMIPTGSSEDGLSKKPTLLLASGVEGRFDQNDSEYEKNYEIVILFPDNVTIPISYDDLPQKVRLAVDKVIQNEDAEEKDQVAAWNAIKLFTKNISKHVWDLKQLDNGVIVPPSGWKCEKCDRTDSLWLNLTDGSILCGGSISYGSGCNGCAIKHYKVTKYPLVVNLQTITEDLEVVDVFSFEEGTSVVDPFLAQHLKHFSIFNEFDETENTEFDWNRILERGQELEPLLGPGYTGVVNLGSSDYLAAIMQVLFSTRSFCSRYYWNQSLQVSFHTAPADPALDLNMQLAKLAHGLLSGKYSNPATKKQEGIPPRMLKSAISARCPQYATNTQEEASEFFGEFMHLVSMVNSGNPDLDPSVSFKFGVEHRYQCTFTDTVTYERNIDLFLCPDIPLDKVINQKALGKLKVDELSTKHIRPRVRLIDLLEHFCAPKERNDAYSTALDAHATMIVTSGLKSFPDYLVIHKKIADVYIDVPDVIDISHMRSKGSQPGEESLPQCDTTNPVVKEESNSTPFVDPAKIDQLIIMGFGEEIALRALQASGGDVDKAVAWIFDPPPVVSNSSSSIAEVDDAVDEELLTLPDGPGRYRLIGLVSHVGETTVDGHYVAHVYKDGRWVFFNDEQVWVSKDPPIDMAYLYFFERITDC